MASYNPASHPKRLAAITTHGLTNTTEYGVWAGMLSRCYSKNRACYKDYGGRGITVCDRWRNSFKAFLEDMKKRPSLKHSIDRWPNNDGNYEPGNCRWATPEEQHNNTRSNRLLTFEGQTMTLSQWANKKGISKSGLRYRLNGGMSVGEALNSDRVKPWSSAEMKRILDQDITDAGLAIELGRKSSAIREKRHFLKHGRLTRKQRAIRNAKPVQPEPGE